MSDSGSESIQRAIRQATELVKDVPPDLRSIAFSKAFDALTGTSTHSREEKRADIRSGGAATVPARLGANGQEDEVIAHLDTLDSTKHPEISNRQSIRNNALHILKVAREDLQIEWLSLPQILHALKDKFRVSVNRNALNMALSRSGAFVDRRRVGDEFMYRIMKAGEEELTKPSVREVSRTAPVRLPKSTSKEPLERRPAQRAAKKGSVAAPSKNRPGPKDVLEQLLADGFFDTPRKIGDVISHIEVKRAHRYKATDMSPTLVRLQREGKLDRDRNADGQYEYQRPRSS